jgi:MAF protein
LERLGIPFDVVPSEIDEDQDADPLSSPRSWTRRASQVARRLAAAKANTISLSRPRAAVLGADTMVTLQGRVYGKPRHWDEAKGMLVSLSARTHQVITAVAVLMPARREPYISHAVTKVKMRDYSEEEMLATLYRHDPFDKAGGYAIQDEVFRPAESYDGCYCNVVGLPLWTTIKLLRKADVELSHVRPSDLLPQCATCPLRPDNS